MINYADIPPIQNEVLMDGDPNEHTVAIHKVTIERILKSGSRDPGDMIALWMFYAYTSRWQKTKQIRATTSYAADGLSWTEERVRKVKRDLSSLSLIEDIQGKNEKGQVCGHYVKIRYVAHASTLPEKQTVESPDHGKPGDKCLRTEYLNAEELGNTNASPSSNEPKKQAQERSDTLSSAPAQILAAWNSLPFRSCRSITGPRLNALQARLKERPFREGWKEAMDRLVSSRFCQGDNDRHWEADFDWFIKPGVVDKILEGKYDDRHPRSTAVPIKLPC
jgi:hypothetical protein